LIITATIYITERSSSGAGGIYSTELWVIWDLSSKAEFRKTALPASPLQRLVM